MALFVSFACPIMFKFYKFSYFLNFTAKLFARINTGPLDKLVKTIFFIVLLDGNFFGKHFERDNIHFLL